MKCVGCGAVLEAEQMNCPYCGALNEEAFKRKQELEEMAKDNFALKRKILFSSKGEIYYKIHKRVNIALFCILFLALLVGSFTFLLLEGSVFGAKGTEEEMVRYYEADDLEGLYICMSTGNLFDPEKYYEYSHIALLWNDYAECQLHFAKAYEQYLKTCFYDAYYLERCIEYGCDVLSGNISYTYPELSEKNKEKLTPYQEQVMILFTGVLKIPEELIEGIYTAEVYDRDESLVKYVLEVLPNEE